MLHGRVPPPTWRDVAMEEIAADTRKGLLALAVGAGLQVTEQPMEAEVSGVCGPRGKLDPERTATRHGTEAGSLTLGGRRVPVRRPRVRATDGSGEVSVPAYELFNGTELLGRMAMERMLAGVSTRRYPTALEPVGQSVAAESKSTSRSAVSRKFLAMTESAMADPLAVDRHRGLARGSVPRVLGRAIGDRERAFLDGPVAGGAVDAELCERFVSGHARAAGGVRDQRRNPTGVDPPTSGLFGLASMLVFSPAGRCLDA